MLIVIEYSQSQVKEIKDMVGTLKASPKVGLINYTVPVCLVKAKHLKVQEELGLEPEDYVVLIDFAVWSPELGDKNDSPGAWEITVEEHNTNCEKIISELITLEKTYDY
jgi:hypothetical protein